MIAVPFRSRRVVAGLPVILILALNSSALAADHTVTGTIAGYECGDNCYLTITSESGEAQVGLCAAPECQPWNEVAEMPEDLIGRAVAATVSTGTQFDNEGNAMGEMQAFGKIEFMD